MGEVGVRELKQKTSEILRRVRQGRETILITYRGRAIARLEPIEDEETKRAKGLAALEEIEALAQEIGARWTPGVSAVEAVREQRREL
jgi:prevent-host-death family protein